MSQNYASRLDREIHKAQDLTTMSRRSFVAASGAAVAAAIAAGTEAARAGEPPMFDAPEPMPEEPAGAWREVPAKVDEAAIVETVDVDVLVVGAGTAGIPCFASACEEIASTGNKVMLIEKNGAGSGKKASLAPHFVGAAFAWRRPMSSPSRLCAPD